MLTLTSAGSEGLSDAMAESSCVVRSSVLMDGCLVTVSSTAGRPDTEASPVLGLLAPSLMSATSANTMGWLAALRLITACAISLVLVVDSTPRTMYSLPCSYSTPPVALRFMLRTAVITSSSATP